MALKLTLKPNEKVFIGGAVVQNGENPAELSILNDVPLLRGKDPVAVLSELAQVRNPIYAQAPLHIASQHGPHEATVAAILRAIGRA